MDTASAAPEVAAPEPKPFLERYYDLHPAYRVTLRWALILTLFVLAFHDSMINLAHTTAAGGLGGYMWTVPIVSVLVAIAVARRHRTELPIHDRQTDIITGGMALVLAVVIEAQLLDRYALYFHLLRLDVVAAWLFLSGSCVVLFGLRPVTRFAWVWGILLMALPLPYYIVVVLLGGGAFAAGAASLLVAAIGTAVAVGRTWRRGVIGSLRAWVVGFAVLITIKVAFPDAPLVVYQQVPAVTAICVVGTLMFLQARRGAPKKILDRKVEPLASRQVWVGVPVVVVTAVALALCHLPSGTSTSPVAVAAPDRLEPGRGMAAPYGWTVTEQQEFPDVDRLYGDGATLVRQYLVANVGTARWDKLSRPRTLVVDSTVTRRPFSLDVYPGRVLYRLTSARISEPRYFDLGHGVQGRLVSVVDDRLLVTWNSIQFAWGDKDLAQRVSVFAVDNHDADAPFPTPSTSVASNIGALFTLLFRGNGVLDQRTPVFKDEDMLLSFTRSLVTAQFP
ncbi:hypothetical protein O6072_10160 [Mycolicibacterium neoaurum]|uniref:hypothetical protein n=1 Tax=Mycolicibacterium neoaurum TaxID=1795 RepID=UPI00248D075E|nr:hypothetical protein [Mycolicibacterium neoaurum]WBP96283.1 hypothetical protein O7W24_09025 [Mycolicibacterium neoaurum]WBS10186.1 hypothetical protein O6072_10160 [Mycolicibacterium neoaurum]